MQPAVKIRNKNTLWAVKLRPRVNDVVQSDGVFYQNLTGYNGAITDQTIWFPTATINSGNPKITINKVAADITGADPFYSINLSTAGIPEFIIDMSVYVDQAGTGAWVKRDPVDFNSETKILAGMDSPTDFPNQKIKILVI